MCLDLKTKTNVFGFKNEHRADPHLLLEAGERTKIGHRSEKSKPVCWGVGAALVLRERQRRGGGGR